jgi:hypothetical protein
MGGKSRIGVFTVSDQKLREKLVWLVKTWRNEATVFRSRTGLSIAATVQGTCADELEDILAQKHDDSVPDATGHS